MALFFICLMAGLIVIAVWKRNYKKETIDNILNEENKKEWLRFLFPMGLWIYDLLSKKQPAQNEEEREWAKALYVREDAKKKLQLQGARQMANFWICLFFASSYIALAVPNPSMVVSFLYFSISSSDLLLPIRFPRV